MRRLRWRADKGINYTKLGTVDIYNYTYTISVKGSVSALRFEVVNEEDECYCN